MDKDILQNHFETVYKEYKDYESFLISQEEDINKQRESFKELVLKGDHTEEFLIDKLFELSIKPLQSDEDLRNLRNRMFSVYDAYKIVIDFPTEIINEINSLNRPTMFYMIDKGSQYVVNKDFNDRYKESRKQRLKEIINQIKIE